MKKIPCMPQCIPWQGLVHLYIMKTYKINSPVLSTHKNLACLGSGVLQLRDSLLFSSLDLSAETNFEDKNISLIYGKHYVCKVTYSTLFCPPVHCAQQPQSFRIYFPGFAAAVSLWGGVMVWAYYSVFNTLNM